MTGANAERHYSDETLMAHLDRELPEHERLAVENHLGECWSCRTRTAEIEQDIQLATRLVGPEDTSGDEEVTRALRVFLARRAEFEDRRRKHAHVRRMAPRASWLRLSWAAAAVLALAAGVATSRFYGPRDPEPEVVVAQATAAEKTFQDSPQPLHQVLRVEARTSSLAAPQDFGKVEIWSDAAAGRYSSRWVGSGDRLRHAVWKPAAATRYAYDPDVHRAVPCSEPAATTHLVRWLQDTTDLSSLEAAFLKWIRSRAWALVSFTEEWAEFADQKGVRVVVERLHDGPRSLWKLSASRLDQGRSFEMVLHVDAATLLPSVQAVRVQAHGQVAELRLILERRHTVRRQEVLPAVFEPAPSIPILRPPPLPPPLPPPPVRPVPPVVAEEPVLLPEWALAELEVRLRSTLHGALECVHVSVSRDPASGLVIRSSAPDRTREVVSGLQGSDYIRIEPAVEPPDEKPSHAAMIRQHARLLDELSTSARQSSGLSPQQETQLAGLFTDHWRALKLEMAHLAVQRPDSGVTIEIADVPIAPQFLRSEEARTLVLKINRQASALADARGLAALDRSLLSLENAMRASWSRAVR